jgi:hypothetical protein
MAVLRKNEEAMGVLLGWPSKSGGRKRSPAAENQNRGSAPLPGWKTGDGTGAEMLKMKRSADSLGTGWSELQHAAHDGALGDVTELLSCGANPNHGDKVRP